MLNDFQSFSIEYRLMTPFVVTSSLPSGSKAMPPRFSTLMVAKGDLLEPRTSKATSSFAAIKVENLGGIAFEPDGKLLVTTNGVIKRYSIENDWKSFSISGGDPVVAASDLEVPKQIIEQDREIYVTDWGTSHQVKVFNAASGKEVRVHGKAGGPPVGDYDEQRMAHPLGMCVDSNGGLWVAEEDYLPKRISLWDAKTGRFINSWDGPTQYGGGGFDHPEYKKRAYFSPVRHP